MTPKELYEWALANGYEDYKIINDSHLGNMLTESEIQVDNDYKWLYV